MRTISSLLVRVLALALPVALAACASTAADFRGQPPRYQTESGRDASAVATCVAQKWSARFNGVAMLPLPNGHSISYAANGLIFYLADITTDKGTTQIRYWAGAFTVEPYILEMQSDLGACR